MGSEKYPYKGILNLLANRAFSGGTNAWTGVDHTAYHVSTAGGQGFLQLLPVFLDHVLYPTLTDAGYVLFIHKDCYLTHSIQIHDRGRKFLLSAFLWLMIYEYRCITLMEKVKMPGWCTVRCRVMRIPRMTSWQTSSF